MSQVYPSTTTFERITELNRIAHYYRVDLGLTGKKLQDSVATLATQRGLCLPGAMLSFVVDFVDKHASKSGRTQGAGMPLPAVNHSACVPDATGGA